VPLNRGPKLGEYDLLAGGKNPATPKLSSGKCQGTDNTRAGLSRITFQIWQSQMEKITVSRHLIRI
jgi:hypothetical protein